LDGGLTSTFFVPRTHTRNSSRTSVITKTWQG
jgi:hypothetical protein